MSLELQALREQEMLALVLLIKPAGSQPAMTHASFWASTQQTLLYQQLIKTPLDITQAYNLSFVQRIYGQ
jgi:hypothetical protein